MSVEKSAFDFVERVRDAESVEALDALFLQHAEPMGVDYALGGVVFARRRVFRPNILIGSKDHAWFRHYSERRLFHRDVVLPRLCTSAQTLTWSDVASERDITSDEKEVLLGPRDFGLRDGLAVPLHGAHGEMGTVTVAGEFFVCDPTIEAAIGMMARQAYEKLIELLDEEPIMPSAPKLTKRQAHCLSLVKSGKTSQEIADSLAISKHTVKEHLENVMQKYSVGTRLEAVVAAERENLLT